MGLEHPTITRARSYGYPYSDKRQEVGKDPLGNEVYTGDEILVLHDEFYLVQELLPQSIEVLEHHGATYKFAK